MWPISAMFVICLAFYSCNYGVETHDPVPLSEQDKVIHKQMLLESIVQKQLLLESTGQKTVEIEP
jgi:hypothetical protein